MSEHKISLAEGYWVFFGDDGETTMGTIHAWKSKNGTRLCYRIVAGDVVIRADDPIDQAYVHMPIKQITKKEFFLHKLKGEA